MLCSPSLRRIAALFAAVAAVSLLLAVVPMDAQEPGLKKNVPSAEDQGKAEATISKLFAARFKEALTDKAAAQSLGGELLSQGKMEKDDDHLQFMALKLASELFARAGDNTGALEAIGELSKLFKVDTVEMKASIYAQVEKNTTSREDAIALTEALLNLVEEALNVDNFAAADKLVATADKAAVKSEKLALAARVQKRLDEVKDARKAFDNIKPLLAKAGTDKEAALAVGKYYCFAKGNYDKGLPLLAKGTDAVLKALAERDLGHPKVPREQVALADLWYELGEKDKGLAQRQTFRRAYHWYQIALPMLNGLTKVRIEKQVEELARLFPAGSGVVSFSGAEITTELRKIEAHVGGVQSVTISSDGKLILSGGSGDNAVRLWDATNGQKKRDFFGHNGSIQSVAISPDRKYGLSGSTDNSMRLWNLETGQEVRRYFGHNDWVRAVRFLPGNKVISACDDRSIRIFDLNNGNNALRTMTGHTNYINGLGISKDGKRAISCSVDFTVRVWNLETGQEVRQFKHNKSVQHVALSPDGKRAVTSSFDNTVKVWDVDAGKELRQLTHPGMVWYVAISPDGRRVYTACGGGMVLNDGTVQFNNNNNVIRVFDLHSGKELRQLTGHTNYVRALDFSPDGRFLVSGSQDNTVRLWGAK